MTHDAEVGDATFAGIPHAGMWKGTARSWTDLNPSKAIHGSIARRADADQQVGWIVTGKQDVGESMGGYMTLRDHFARSRVVTVRHASVWNGSAASWTDLSPSGAGDSVANGVCQGMQVGSAMVRNAPNSQATLTHRTASLWTGTAASWVDLGSYLPRSYGASEAEEIWADADDIFVVGWADKSRGRSDDTTHAVLWRCHRPRS